KTRERHLDEAERRGFAPGGDVAHGLAFLVLSLATAAAPSRPWSGGRAAVQHIAFAHVSGRSARPEATAQATLMGRLILHKEGSERAARAFISFLSLNPSHGFFSFLATPRVPASR